MSEQVAQWAKENEGGPSAETHDLATNALKNLLSSVKEKKSASANGVALGSSSMGSGTLPAHPLAMKKEPSKGSSRWNKIRESHVPSLAKHTLPELRPPSTYSRWKTYLVGSVKQKPAGVWSMTGQTGSFAYMAPEVVKGERYNEKADIYAVGVIMWEVFARMVVSATYQNAAMLEAHAQSVAQEGYRPSMPKFFPPELAALIAKCWSQESKDRPSAQEVLTQLESLKAKGTVDDMFPGGGACGCL